MEQLRPSTETQASCLKMCATGPPPRIILELPDDILNEIFDLINARSLVFVDSELMQLLLTHSRFLEAAQGRVLRHQSHIKTYSAVTINTMYGSGYAMYAEDGAPWIEEMPSSTTFDSAVKMLIAMHKDKMLAAYVRSLNYIAYPDAFVQGADRRKAALEEFGNSENSLRTWLNGLEPVVDTKARLAIWMRHLLDRDNGEGLAILSKQLPQLQSLRLGGYRYRWLGLSGVFAVGAQANYATNFAKYSWRSPLPSLNIQRVVLCNVHSIPDAFLAFEGRHVKHRIRQLIIHCDPMVFESDPFLRAVSAPSSVAWLKVPDIKVFGYQGPFSNLTNAMRRVQPGGFDRLEVVLAKCFNGGLSKIASELEPLFKIEGLHKATFSYNADKSIGMVIRRNKHYKQDNTRGVCRKDRRSRCPSLD